MPDGLVPAPTAGTQAMFLRRDGWADRTTANYFISDDAQWRLGDGNHLFLRGDGQWANMVFDTPGSELALGSLVKFGTFYSVPIVWEVADKNHSGFPSDSLTLVSKYVLTLRCFDAKEPTNTNSLRKTDGNNDYVLSNIRQWANSDAPAGQWYAAQHTYDAPPSTANVYGGYNAYDTEPGFLSEFTEREKALLLDTKRLVAPFPANQVQCTDKVWLPTYTEYGFGTFSLDGTKLALYSTAASRVKNATSQCMAHNKYPNAPSSPAYYYNATPHSYTGYPQMIYGTQQGNVMDFNAYYSNFGFVPAINIPLNTAFSTTPDAEGCYAVIL